MRRTYLIPMTGSGSFRNQRRPKYLEELIDLSAMDGHKSGYKQIDAPQDAEWSLVECEYPDYALVALEMNSDVIPAEDTRAIREALIAEGTSLVQDYSAADLHAVVKMRRRLEMEQSRAACR